ncbi:2-aminoethanethiol dioxygenase [Sarcoptes scabiei]|uniref:2-aminoethanethiol dioxygenase n=1 Tax=Sarcoptes scabiei TaxID=52283 RepID=A0A834VBH5_SARSC|nr:2-aminoethanethiol dioxygenase [Sarcoptes scabiei]
MNAMNSINAPITYTSLFENQFFSLTVFGFRRPTSRIPLHDHPGMYGFVKCVYGSLSVKSFDLISTYHEIPSEIYEKVPKSDHHNIVPSIFIGEDIVLGDNHQIATFAPNERNLHVIRPLTDEAVMVDIIAPPYTSQTCSYFYEFINDIYDSKLGRNITWLLKTLNSHEYYCETIEYQGPAITV